MEESRLLEGRLSCQCTVCITWRRLGCELGKGHHHQGYLGVALTRLRLTFNDLLDFRTLHRLEEPPLAGGGAPAAAVGVPPQLPPAVVPPPPCGEERGRSSKVKEESPSKKSQPPSSPKRERRREPSLPSGKRRSHRPKARSPVSAESRHLREGQPDERPRGSRVKPSESDQEEEGKTESHSPDRRALRHPATSPDKGETRTSSRTRQRAAADSDEEVDKSEAPRRRSRSPRREGCAVEEELPPDAPPGRWVLSERGRQPYVPAGQRRPPEPAGPPPHWKGVPGVHQRSKGVVRRQRGADIAAFGFDPARKKLRQERHG